MVKRVLCGTNGFGIKQTGGNKMYNEIKCESMPSLTGQVNNPTISERLNQKKRRLEKELEEVNKTIKLFEVHPEVTEVLNALSKIGMR